MEAVATDANLKDLRLRPKESDHTPGEWIAELRKRDYVIWRGIKEIIDNVAHHGESLVIEGNIWPDYIDEITPSYNVRAVFLVDTDVSGHAARLIKLARSNATQNNWMRGWPEEKIHTWAAYNVARSLEVERLAKAKGFPVFDVAHNISSAQASALKHLLPFS